MPSLLVHMMVLINAANTLETPEERAAEEFLFPRAHPVPGGSHPVAEDVEIGEGISQLALLGSNSPDIPGYTSYDVDLAVYFLSLFGGGVIGIASIYTTLCIGGEREDDSNTLKNLLFGVMWGLGVLLLLIPLLISNDTDTARQITTKKWFGLLGSMLGLPMLASGAALFFIYTKEANKKWCKRKSFWVGLIPMLLGGASIIGVSAWLSLKDAKTENLNFSITYVVGYIIGFLFAFSAGYFAFYKGADRETSISRGIALLLSGIFLAILFPCLFPKVPNQQEEEWFNLLHKHKTGDYAIELIRIAKGLSDENEKRMLMAFALGHISHIAADTMVHPYVNMFGGKVEDIEKWYENFHRTVEVEQDSWIAKEFFEKDDVFAGESWTKYIEGTEEKKEELDGYMRDAFRATYYGSQPEEGFIKDAIGVVKDLVLDEAFDNELASVRIPLTWLCGITPFIYGGFLTSILWSFPVSQFRRLAGIGTLSDSDADEVLYKALVVQDLKDIITKELDSATRFEIYNMLSDADKNMILNEEVTTIEEAQRILNTLSPDLRRKILDVIDRENIKTDAKISIIISGLSTLVGFLLEIWSRSHWEIFHIACVATFWSTKFLGFILLFCGDTSLLCGTPIYYLSSSFGDVFSLDQTLYSLLTSKSIVPRDDVENKRIRHTALGEGEVGSFYRDVLLEKSVEFTKILWKEAVKFYNGSIEDSDLRQTLRNWNIDTGYRIEAKVEEVSGERTTNITFKHIWEEFDI